MSRLRLFEQCPLAFYFRYVNKPDPALDAARGEPAEFGTVLHDALERTYQWIIDEEYEGPFPEGEALDFFRRAWIDSGLVGIGLYQEGRDLLRQYAETTGQVDHMRTLSVEREFNLLVGPDVCRLVDASEKAGWAEDADHFVINGFIDRVDRVDSGAVEIIDYKSGRLLFSKEELADDLQMSIYALVAQCLYPWATEIRMSFHMLRHGIRQTTVRTAEDLASAREYVRALGTRTERGPYPPKLNTYCATCDHKARCETYKLALDRKLEVVAVSVSDLTALATERERVAKIAKAAYARKETLDGILRSAIGEAESLQLGDVVYRLVQYSDTSYPMAELLALFVESGVDLTPALTVDNKALDALLNRVETDEHIPRKVRDFLRVRVAAKSIKLPQRPRLDARQKKKP